MHSVKRASRVVSHITRLYNENKAVGVIVGVHLEAMSLSYSDDVSGIEKEQQSKPPRTLPCCAPYSIMLLLASLL